MNLQRISRIASLIGEPARTAMLFQLRGGGACTASELAKAAAISAPTASRHLSQLVNERLLSVTKIGRHRYYRLASAEVSELLEQIINFGKCSEHQTFTPLPSWQSATQNTLTNFSIQLDDCKALGTAHLSPR